MAGHWIVLTLVWDSEGVGDGEGESEQHIIKSRWLNWWKVKTHENEITHELSIEIGTNEESPMSSYIDVGVN